MLAAPFTWYPVFGLSPSSWMFKIRILLCHAPEISVATLLPEAILIVALELSVGYPCVDIS